MEAILAPIGIIFIAAILAKVIHLLSLKIDKRNSKERQVPVICIHDWYLLDTNLNWGYHGVESHSETTFHVGCTKCNQIKVLDEVEFKHFNNYFEVKNKGGYV